MSHPLNVPQYPSEKPSDPNRPRHPLERSAPGPYQPPAQPAQGRLVPLPLSRPILTYVLLALNIVIFIIDHYVLNGQLTRIGEKLTPAILAGEYWRFFTPMFLHVDEVHIGLNSMSLYVVGTQVERLYGLRRFAAIYFLCGVAGVLLSFALSPVPSIGASGAIFGLVGALLPLLYRNRRVLPSTWRSIQNILWVIGLNLAFGILSGIVDNWGHIGGLIGGLVLGWWCTPLFKVMADPVSAARITDGSSPAISWAAITAFALVLIGLAYVLIMVHRFGFHF